MAPQEYEQAPDAENPLERASRALENMNYGQEKLLEIARDNSHPEMLTRIAAYRKLERMNALTREDAATFEKLKQRYFNESAGEFGQSATPFFGDRKR